MAASPQQSRQPAYLQDESPKPRSLPATPQPSIEPEILPPADAEEHPEHAQARGFAQAFGLHPAVALLTIAVDLMLFGKDGILYILGAPTGGLSVLAALLISAPVGAALGFIAYFAQKHWYGDERPSAMIKASMVALLTAIPTSIPGIIYGSFGLVGLFRRKPQN
jgi:hypothetical protein